MNNLKTIAVVRYVVGFLIFILLLWSSVGSIDRLRSHRFNLIDRLDAIIYDFKIKLSLSSKWDDRIVILDIDEASLSRLGHWPWPRSVLKDLMDRLFDDYKINVLGLDVVFAESDKSSGLWKLDELAKQQLLNNESFKTMLNKIRPQLDYDQLFADSLKNRKVVMGYTFLRDNPERGGNKTIGSLPMPAFKAMDLSGKQIYSMAATGYIGNLNMLQEQAAGAGHINTDPDPDGIVRRTPLLYEYDNNYYTSLSLAMFRQLLGNPEVHLGFPSTLFGQRTKYLEWLELPLQHGSSIIPTDASASAFVPFLSTGRSQVSGFKYYSVADVIEKKVPLNALKGRIAILGTTAQGLLDLRATPVSSVYPGVEVHANLLAGMIDGTLRQAPSYMLGAEVVLMILVAAMIIILSPRLNPLQLVLFFSGLLIGLIALDFYLWYYQGLILYLASIIILVFSLFLFNTTYSYFVEARNRNQMAQLFGQYVPPELVEEMSRNPDQYSMEGRSTELSVLFCDIRNFTHASESMDPKALTQFINEFLSEMTKVIGAHKGTVDKYIGDAIMAFWGAPVDDEHHALHSIQAAVNMQTALSMLNKQFATQKRPEVEISIGINSGTAIVGDMGSKTRLAYTAMGDAVNVASRLESISKLYGVDIVVGEETQKQCSAYYAFKELDRIAVKGRSSSVVIYQPLGREGEVDVKLLDENKMWNAMLRHYRQKNWDQADIDLLNMSRLYPDRMTLYKLFQERISAFRLTPPEDSWGGVVRMLNK